MRTILCLALCFSMSAAAVCRAEAPATAEQHLLYVATPGVRDDPQYGGVGIAVFDIDHDHRFLRRIAIPALGDEKNANAVKGVCASAATGRLYLSTTRDLTCLDLSNDKIIWRKTYPGGCDRMSISPDGKTIYEPTLEGAYWHVIDAGSGDEVAKIDTGSGSHNTVFGRDGRQVFLAGLHSPVLAIADATKRTAAGTVGPFSAAIRPFTVNGRSTLCYVCVNDLLGFEVGDITTGKKLCRVEVTGFSKGPTARHGCPSHGVGLTPDEKEVWATDAHNRRLHLFDNSQMPPKQIASIELRDEPGWITFSVDGRFAYPSTGDVIDTKSRQIIAHLTDEANRAVQSEKLLEVDFADGKPVRNGDQCGVGRVVSN